MLEIRPYQSSDAAAVSQVIATAMRRSNTADYPIERLQPLIDYFTAEKLDELCSTRTCLVAVSDGEVIGTASLDGDELATVFVHPDHQGKKAGARLIEQLEVIAREQGITTVRVESSITGTAFYEALGYRRTGVVHDATAGVHIGLEKKL